MEKHLPGIQGLLLVLQLGLQRQQQVMLQRLVARKVIQPLVDLRLYHQRHGT